MLTVILTGPFWPQRAGLASWMWGLFCSTLGQNRTLIWAVREVLNMVVSKRTLGAVLAPDGLMNSRLVDLFAVSLRVDFCSMLKSAFNNVIMLYKTDKKSHQLLSTGNDCMRPEIKCRMVILFTLRSVARFYHRIENKNKGHWSRNL